MINKASDLLALFIEQETKKLADVDMRHMPTLGKAYEEITKQGIDQNFVIPKSLDLKVVSGFISVDDEVLPEQLDCMLVHGEGNRYGLTNDYIYPIERVLCIFEVKKTLRKEDYLDAIEHLGKIRRRYAESFERKLRSGDFEPNISIARKHFAQLTGKSAPNYYRDLNYLPHTEGIIFYTLVQESLAPVTIIHSYEGYKTEQGLRKTFIDLIEEKWKSGNSGLGLPSLPSLVTSNSFCLIKANGMPFMAIRDDFSWAAIVSTRYNTAKMILELIWSKISFYFDVKMPWNDGLEMDSVHPLLVAEPFHLGQSAGWKYNCVEISERSLRRENNELWEPSKLALPEMSALDLMAMRGGYLELDSGLESYLIKNYERSLDEVKKNLLLSREFMIDGNYIRPINSSTLIITNADGSGFVSSARDRFELWCAINQIPPNFMYIIFIDE